jgi:FdhD protein
MPEQPEIKPQRVPAKSNLEPAVQTRVERFAESVTCKHVGWAMMQRKLPLSDYVLVVSGRVSYEIVQKAVVAGIPFIAAVGAPSSLAVDLADRFDLTLVGFLTRHSMNVYRHAERILPL